MVILNIRDFIMNRTKISVRSVAAFWSFGRLITMFGLLAATSLNAQDGVSVSARATAIKGVVMASTPGGGEHQLNRGDSIRGGTVVQSRAEAGALFRPSSNSALVVYPSSKVRFDGADVSPGHENVTCTILEGKAWFSVGAGDTAAEGAAEPSSNVKITVVTEQGTIEGKAGNWTVQHQEGRTMVAVGEGTSLVSIGGAGGAATGGVTGQVEVPKGSVIWLYTREGGEIEAEVVNTESGTVSKVGPGGTLGAPTKADPTLLADSKGGLTTPSSQGGSQQLPTTPGGQPNNTTPTQTPDFSTPTPNVPVVSSETP